MILQSLVQYYETLEQKGKISSPGWCTAKVSFALELSGEGKLKRVIPLKVEKERGKKMEERRRRGQRSKGERQYQTAELKKTASRN